MIGMQKLLQEPEGEAPQHEHVTTSAEAVRRVADLAKLVELVAQRQERKIIITDRGCL